MPLPVSIRAPVKGRRRSGAAGAAEATVSIRAPVKGRLVPYNRLVQQKKPVAFANPCVLSNGFP